VRETLDRAVVHSDDPSFWSGLRRGAPELEAVWVETHSSRECLVAVEDPRARVIVLDGAIRGTDAKQLLLLIKQIRPKLPVVFGFDVPDDDQEREVRESGVLYYGDRRQVAEMIEVIRISLPPSAPSGLQRRMVENRVESR